MDDKPEPEGPALFLIKRLGRAVVDQDDLVVLGGNAALVIGREATQCAWNFALHIVGNEHHRYSWVSHVLNPVRIPDDSSPGLDIAAEPPKEFLLSSSCPRRRPAAPAVRWYLRHSHPSGFGCVPRARMNGAEDPRTTIPSEA